MDQSTESPVAVLTAGANSNGLSSQPLNPASATQFITEQPAGQWLARVFLGAEVHNAAGQRVGDINDLLFNASGHITTIVLGVGGFLGMGEKTVAVPFGALTNGIDRDGSRQITVELDKDVLMQAPAFHATEKTILDSVKDKATELGHRTADKAAELREQAARKLMDMTKTTPAKP